MSTRPTASTTDLATPFPGSDAFAGPAARRFHVSDGARSIDVPLPMNSLADFRAWVLSEAFPERIRASYVNGSIEVDMSPDEYFGHNFPKGEISSQLHLFIKRKNLGFACFDRAYFTHIAADVSTEPDFLFFSHEALASGRVRFVPRVSDRPGSMELEGAPDLIVEIVSDSSVAKDRRRLPAAYFTAGVLEYWLVDARGPEIEFHISTRGETDWVDAAVDAEGFRRSAVLGGRFRLDRTQRPSGVPEYDLRVSD